MPLGGMRAEPAPPWSAEGEPSSSFVSLRLDRKAPSHFMKVCTVLSLDVSSQACSGWGEVSERRTRVCAPTRDMTYMHCAKCRAPNRTRPRQDLCTCTCIACE